MTLKYCPFCGNKAYIVPLDYEMCEVEYERDADNYAVKCGTCGANVIDADRDGAINLWNARLYRKVDE